MPKKTLFLKGDRILFKKCAFRILFTAISTTAPFTPYCRITFISFHFLLKALFFIFSFFTFHLPCRTILRFYRFMPPQAIAFPLQSIGSENFHRTAGLHFHVRLIPVPPCPDLQLITTNRVGDQRSGFCSPFCKRSQVPEMCPQEMPLGYACQSSRRFVAGQKGLFAIHRVCTLAGHSFQYPLRGINSQADDKADSVPVTA